MNVADVASRVAAAPAAAQVPDLRKTVGRLVENFSVLSFVQVLNLVFPLLTYPIAVRAVGAELYGAFVYQLGIASIFSVICDLGVNTYGARETARALAGGRSERSRAIMAGLAKVKLVAGMLGWLACGLVGVFSGGMVGPLAVLLIASVILQSALQPQWYYQGSQTLRVVGWATLASRLASLGLLLLFVRAPEDFLFLVIANMVPPLAAGGFLTVLMLRRENLRLREVLAARAWPYVRASTPFSAANVVAITKDKLGVIVVAHVLSLPQVAIFDLAMKVVELSANVFYNVTRAVYPYFSANKNIPLFKKVLFGALALSAAVAGAVYFSGGWIATILGGAALLEAQTPLRIMAFALPLLTASSLLGHIVLLCNGKDASYTVNLASSLVVYLALLGAMALLELGSLRWIAWAYLASIAFEMLHRIYLVRRGGLMSWIL